MKIPNCFSTTVFGKHKTQYESGVPGTDFPNTFFFLPSTVDRIEKLDKYMGSVNLDAVDINVNDFGENLNPSVLD